MLRFILFLNAIKILNVRLPINIAIGGKLALILNCVQEIQMFGALL